MNIQILFKRSKLKSNVLIILHIFYLFAFKIVETNALDLGYSDILKQKKNEKEQIVAFASKHWNLA